MSRRASRIVGGVLAGGVLLAGVLGGRGELWSNSIKPAGGLVSAAQTAASGEAENLQNAFMRIAQQVGPSVVSISTEQIERVRQYFRGYPYMGPGGNDPFEEFFRQFYGQTPEPNPKRRISRSGICP